MATTFAVVGEEYPTLSVTGLKAHGTKLSSPVAMIDRQYATPSGGTGYLAGEYPAGTTTVEGVPQSATVRVHYRPSNKGNIGDGVLVAEVESEPDGTWRVDGLDSHKRYDVIGRKDGFNDVIMANIKPYDLQRFSKHDFTVTVAKPLAIPLPIIGGEGDVIATIASGSLPSGVTLVNNILIGSWPTGATGDYVVTFDLTDDIQTLQDTLTLELVVLPLVLAGEIPEVLPKDEAYSLQFVASGGEAPYTFSVSSGTLPSGLTLSSGGLLSGTPDTTESFSFTVEVEDVRSAKQYKSALGQVKSQIAARYWRVNVTASNNHCSSNELIFASTTGGASIATGGTAITGGSFAGAGHDAANAFNGITNDDAYCWASSVAGSGWLGYDFGVDVVIQEVRIFPRGTYNQSFNTWTIQYSNDGVNWTVIDTQTGVTSWDYAGHTSKNYVIQ